MTTINPAEPDNPMTAKKKSLGRGLDALLGTTSVMAGTGADDGLCMLPIERVQPGKWQPRKNFAQGALQQLADSIKTQGVLQPIIVRPTNTDSSYEIIAGERRWRAAQLAGLHELPAVIKTPDNRTAACIALTENLQREDLNPLEQAQGLARLLDEFGMTHERAAKAVGRSRSAVTNTLRLLELSEAVKRLLAQGQLEMGHARALLPLPEDQQIKAARLIIKAGMSARAAEALARRLRQSDGSQEPAQSEPDPDVRRLETDLAERLGAAVKIQHKKSGKGTLRINYHSLDELDGILAKFK